LEITLKGTACLSGLLAFFHLFVGVTGRERETDEKEGGRGIDREIGFVREGREMSPMCLFLNFPCG
jgi:hypothetical protein